MQCNNPGQVKDFVRLLMNKISWQNLEDLKENPMVRHECAEALGAIAKVSFKVNNYDDV